MSRKAHFDEDLAIKLLPLTHTTVLSKYLGIARGTLTKFKEKLEKDNKLMDYPSIRLNVEQIESVKLRNEILYEPQKLFKRNHRKPITFVEETYVEDNIAKKSVYELAAELGRTVRATKDIIASRLGLDAAEESGYLLIEDILRYTGINKSTFKRDLYDRDRIKPCNNELSRTSEIRTKVKGLRYVTKEMKPKGVRCQVKNFSQQFKRLRFRKHFFTYPSVVEYVKTYYSQRDFKCMYCDTSIKGTIVCPDCAPLAEF